MVYTLTLIRHGESSWNKENRFTGWTNVSLSELGVKEAMSAGQELKAKGYTFDLAFTSVLKRAVETTWSVLREMDLHHIPVQKSWRLNERHYGALQGLNKSETAQLHGEEQVKIWRRSYDVPPPALELTDSKWAGNNPVYSGLPKDCCPLTECLKDTVIRVLPFWSDQIAPAILSGKKVLVSAHGNSLRALVKHLDNMSEAEVLELNIPTGVPLIYYLDDNLKPIKHEYLMDEEQLKKKIDAVANQGKTG